MTAIVETDIPARLDRLRWGRFHTLVAVALGISWVLDGLEVTLAGAVSGVLKSTATLGLSNTEIGGANSAYLAGAVCGALGFGWLTDRWGRRRLFFVTLAIYLAATAATAASWNVWSYCLFRFLTGAGIGGEYTAINSAIQELIPARYRGHTDLVVNGSFWLGAALGAGGSIVLLDPAVIATDVGWRLAFLLGAALGLTIFIMRFWIPESPRWLIMHGRLGEAERVIASIEIGEGACSSARATALPRLRLQVRKFTPLGEVFATLVHVWRQRTLVALVLMAAQAFLYNAVFFTYALILTDFYGVRSDRVGWYLLPFAAGNFLGPLLLGRLFDTIGRRRMIAFTYGVSGLLLAITGYLFAAELLSAAEQTAAWTVIFFFASSAASAAYLTVGETFPLEIRALAIAIFFAFGTGIGGVAGPLLFGVLIDTASRWSVFAGYLFCAVLMLAAGFTAGYWGVNAERRPLETVARPLAMID